MKFLSKFYQLLIKYFLSIFKIFFKKRIPSRLEKDEILVRGIVHPLFLKKNKLSENAFLPPPREGRKDVSVLRHKYTNDDFCKSHAYSLNIGDHKYCGLGVVLVKSINEVNSVDQFQLDNGEIVSVKVIATPIIEKNLPMHADIVYSHHLQDDEPKTIIRKMARNIVKKAKYIEDPDPDNQKWKGIPITQSLFSGL